MKASRGERRISWSAATAGLALALGAASPAFAQTSEATSHFYAGGTFGQAHWRPGCANGAACDDTDNALGVFGGYQINRILGVEVGFRNLGKVNAPGSSIKADVWEAVLVGRLPAPGSLSLYGKIGPYRGNAEGSGTLTPNKETNYNATVGAGLQLDLNRNLALRGEWQSYSRLAGGTLGPRSDVSVLSVGALWRFR